MTSPSTSVAATSPPPRRKRPPPGPPAEVWFWRVLPKKGRGEHRTLADNVQYDGWELIWERRPLAPGRYRLEFRDDRRAIVGVRYAIVPDPRSQERPYFTTGRRRRSQRTVPAARPAWEPRAAPPPPATARPATARSASTTPALHPPGAAVTGKIWQRRQNGDWEQYDRNLAIPKNYRRLWLEASRTVVLVYAPNGTWPGYVPGSLKGGEACLVPQR